MVGELSPALGPIPCTAAQRTPSTRTDPHASLLHRVGAGRKRKWKRSMGQRGAKQSKPKDRICLEKEQRKGGEPSFRGEPPPGQAEIASSRTQVHMAGPHQHCSSLLGLL